MKNMTLIDRVLAGKPVREAVDDEFPEIDPDDLYDVAHEAEQVLKDAGAANYLNVRTKPYGTGFKVEITKNESGVVNLENGLDRKFINELGWEKLDSEELRDGTVVLYYR